MIKSFRSTYRKRWFALALLIQALFSWRGLAQTRPEEDLKQFEGRYEYLNGASTPQRCSLRDS